MNTDRKLFFAIPFGSATRCLYERVCESVRARYPRVTTEIGSEQVGPSRDYSNIASFKAQNRQLTEQFVAKIREADIIVADLTHNNPNVHVELGMALLSNKNILRVTGRFRRPRFRPIAFPVISLLFPYETSDTVLTTATGRTTHHVNGRLLVPPSGSPRSGNPKGIRPAGHGEALDGHQRHGNCRIRLRTLWWCG